MKKPLLLLDSSSERNVLSLIDPEGETFRLVKGGKGGGKDLAPAVDQLLKERDITPKDLKGIVVGVGPGSFTGIRIALALAQGMAAACGVALYPVSSLAFSLPETDCPFLLLYDARRGDFFAQRGEFTQKGVLELEAPLIMSELEVKKELANGRVWSSSVPISNFEPSQFIPPAESVKPLAEWADQFSPQQPPLEVCYLRPSPFHSSR